MSDLKPLPCPFCGHTGLSFEEGSTFRWGVASCDGCDATCGEIRRNYPDDGKWHAEAIEAWNRRAQPAQAVPLLTDAEVDAAIPPPTTFGQRQPPWNGSDMQILRGTARAIESLVRSKLGAGVGWIACIDAMPPKNTEVLIKFRDTPLPSTGQYTGSPFDNDGWCYPKENDPDEVGPVTHWQPLPPPPDNKTETTE